MFSTEYLVSGPGSKVVHIRRALERRLAAQGRLHYYIVGASTPWRDVDYWVFACADNDTPWAVSGPHKTEQTAVKTAQRLYENPFSL